MDTSQGPRTGQWIWIESERAYAWWDGSEFTSRAYWRVDHWECDDARDLPTGTEPVQAPRPPRNRAASTGFTLSMIGLLVPFFLLGPILGPIGVGLGLRGLAPERREGRRRAMASVVIGCIDIVLGLLWWYIASRPDFEM